MLHGFTLQDSQQMPSGGPIGHDTWGLWTMTHKQAERLPNLDRYTMHW